MADDPGSDGGANDETTVQLGDLRVGVPAEVANGVYSNLVLINHTPDEFVLDFSFVQPGTPRANVRSRVVLSPAHLKRLLGALQQNLARYEQTFGPVPDRQPQPPTGGGPTGTGTVN